MLSIFTLVVVMPSSYEDLEGCKWQEVEIRSAVVMILINSAGETSNQEIAGTLGVNLRTVQRIRAKLETTWDVDAIVYRKKKADGATRTVRDAAFVASTENVEKTLKKSIFVKGGSTSGRRTLKHGPIDGKLNSNTFSHLDCPNRLRND